jgi:hypothetical protein
MKQLIKKWLGIDKLYRNSVDDHLEIMRLARKIKKLEGVSSLKKGGK